MSVPENNDPPVAPPVVTPPTPPVVTPQVGDPPAPSRHDVSALPQWAQVMVSELRQENAGHRTAKQKAEQDKLAADGQWQALFESEKAKREALENAAAEQERISLARRVAKDVLGALVADVDIVAERLKGTTEQELRADAESFKKALPSPTAPRTEGGRGGTISGQTREQRIAQAEQELTAGGYRPRV